MKIQTPYVTLQQVLKYVGFVSSGGSVKFLLEETTVLVNGVRETRRGRKLYPGDCVRFQDQSVCIESDRDHES